MRDFLVASMLLTFAVSAAIPQEKSLLVADFNKAKNIDNIGYGFGTWDKDPNDKTQGCRMTFAEDDALGSADGMSVRLDYDVDSTNPAYNGFWLKLDSTEVLNFDTLSFFIRGDAATGFTKKIKVEVKDKKGGVSSHPIDGISEKWQKVSIQLKFDHSIKKPFSEFTIVFDDVNSSPKKGVIFVDEIEFAGGIGQ